MIVANIFEKKTSNKIFGKGLVGSGVLRAKCSRAAERAGVTCVGTERYDVSAKISGRDRRILPVD